MSIFKACDIRGRYGIDLFPEHARRLGEAICAIRKPVRVLVGGDGRQTTPLLKQALIEAFVRGGCQVVDIGMVPTAAFYYARQHLGIETGVQVTASHNPPGDNGFKLILGPLPITPEELQALAAWIEGEQVLAEPPGAGVVQQVDILPAYQESLIPLIPDLGGLKVVVDCANGMAGTAARWLWQRTGAQVTYLLEDIDGTFPSHPPNPSEEANLALLQQAVAAQKADLGVAYDGDADRVVFVDEQGHYVPNDKVIVLFAEIALQDGPETIVYDQKCSQVVPDTVQLKGGHPIRERSGHTFIKGTFLNHQAAYAGELSGHHFLRQTGGDDGLAASLVFAHHLKESGQPLSELARGILSYPATPDIRLPMKADDIQALLGELKLAFSEKADVEQEDGIRMEFAHGWALVRPSVTEPVVSLRVEGQDAPSLRQIVQELEAASPLLWGKVKPYLGE